MDKLAERIRALGQPAPGSFAEFNKTACIKEATHGLKAPEMFKQLLAGHEILANCSREIFKVATKAGDEATGDLLNERMAAHEKAAWMLRSSLLL